MFAAVTLIPVSDAISISFINPVFAMILAFLFLKEKVSLVRWLAIGIALVGSIILLRPSFDSFELASFIAFGAALCLGIEVIIFKKLSGIEAPLQILSINNSIGFVISITSASFVWVNPSDRQWAELFALGVIMVTAQSLFIQAMRRSNASYVLPFSYLTLVFATIYYIWVFKSLPDWISLLGAFTIVSGSIILSMKEFYEHQDPKI